MKDDSSLDSFVKRMWELHDEMVHHLAVGVWNTIFTLDTPAGRPYTRLNEIVRAPRALS